MLSLLGSMLAGKGGRLLGGALGGRTGAMVGGMAGALIGGRKMGGMLKGAASKLKGGGDNDELTDSDAEILIRLMVNSAKADGEIDETEVQTIVENLGEASDDDKEFLKAEMAKPLIAPSDLGKQVDDGLKADAYVISLMAIKLDTEAETNYLRELSAAMGIDEDARNEIHDQLEVARV